MKKKFLSHLLCIALVILCSALMPIMLFFANVGAVKFYEIAVFIGIYSFIGLAVFTVLRFILKSEYKAGIAAGFFSLIFQNTGRLSKIMSYKFILVIFVLVVGALIFAIWKFLKEEIAKLFVPVLSIVITMLLIMNTVMSIGKIVSVANVDAEIQADIDKQYEYITSFKDDSKTPEELPNVYFIIVDEYAGFNSIKKFYDYDNAEFETFLKNHNFQISKSSTNYFHATLECLANVFNLELSTKNIYNRESEFYCKGKVSEGIIFRLAEDIGYTVSVAQSSQLINYESETNIYADKWSTTQDGKSSIDLLTSPSMLIPFTDYIRSILNNVPLDYFVGYSHLYNQSLASIEPLLHYSKDESVGKANTFNLCYVSSPHEPFFFDQFGSINDSYNLNNWVDKTYYLNQFKYCTTLIKNAIENIIKNDPDSVIILMSDHGVRDHYNGTKEHEWMNKMTAQDHTDILCAVYYQGKEFTDIEGMCGSNVLISVVNKAWGYDIPLIEQSDNMYQYYKVPEIL